MSEQKVDVLAVIDAAIQRAADDATQYKFEDKDGLALREARAAIAELIRLAPAVAELAWHYTEVCDSDPGSPVMLELEAFNVALARVSA